jgi:TonB family protein
MKHRTVLLAAICCIFASSANADQPRVILRPHRCEHFYPKELVPDKTQIVELQFLVTEQGHVEDVSISQSANPALDDAAKRCVLNWRYTHGRNTDPAASIRWRAKIVFTAPDWSPAKWDPSVPPEETVVVQPDP